MSSCKSVVALAALFAAPGTDAVRTMMRESAVLEEAGPEQVCSYTEVSKVTHGVSFNILMPGGCDQKSCNTYNIKDHFAQNIKAASDWATCNCMVDNPKDSEDRQLFSFRTLPWFCKPDNCLSKLTMTIMRSSGRSVLLSPDDFLDSHKHWNAACTPRTPGMRLGAILPNPAAEVENKPELAAVVDKDVTLPQPTQPEPTEQHQPGPNEIAEAIVKTGGDNAGLNQPQVLEEEPAELEEEPVPEIAVETDEQGGTPPPAVIDEKITDPVEEVVHQEEEKPAEVEKPQIVIEHPYQNGEGAVPEIAVGTEEQGGAPPAPPPAVIDEKVTDPVEEVVRQEEVVHQEEEAVEEIVEPTAQDTKAEESDPDEDMEAQAVKACLQVFATKKGEKECRSTMSVKDVKKILGSAADSLPDGYSCQRGYECQAVQKENNWITSGMDCKGRPMKRTCIPLQITPAATKTTTTTTTTTTTAAAVEEDNSRAEETAAVDTRQTDATESVDTPTEPEVQPEKDEDVQPQEEAAPAAVSILNPDSVSCSALSKGGKTCAPVASAADCEKAAKELNKQDYSFRSFKTPMRNYPGGCSLRSSKDETPNVYWNDDVNTVPARMLSSGGIGWAPLCSCQ